MGKLNVDGTEIQVLQIEEDDYISLTDMVRKIDNGPALIEKWLRNKNTIEFLGIWEEMYNADFNAAAYEEIMLEAGLNRFIMSVKQWVSRTNSKGIVAKAGRYGGTYAYKDIAFEFASWVSPQFKLYLIKEFERLKKEEQALLGWSAKRELAKINYRIHTDAIMVNLIPPELTLQQTSIIYASEADVLNMALFGMTAKQWRDNNPNKKGNIRDYASINELICLSNMENINAVLIEDGLSQKERLIKLNKIAIHQMSILEEQTTKISYHSSRLSSASTNICKLPSSARQTHRIPMDCIYQADCLLPLHLAHGLSMLLCCILYLAYIKFIFICPFMIFYKHIKSVPTP